MLLNSPIQINPKWLPPHALEQIRREGVLTVAFSRGERKMLRRKVKARPSEWAAKNIVVPMDSATGKRRWDPSLTQYWAGVMDASFYPSVQEVAACAVAQTGKTQFIMNCLGYSMDRAPGNIILVMQDEKAVGEMFPDRIIPMINDSPLLSTYKTGYVDDLTATKIKLRHVKVYPAWATSASRMASKPAPYAVLDEENKFPETANKQELTPVDLVRMRSRTFGHMRKLWRASTPTIEGVGISKALDESEVVFDFYPRCPVCGHDQRMVFERIKWDGRSGADPDTLKKTRSAWYECEHCDARWDDRVRDMAVRAGGWKERRREAIGEGQEVKQARIIPGLALFEYLETHNPIKIGFHVPAWLSHYVSLSECASAFIEGLKDTLKYKAFCNNYAGEPWKIIRKEREETRILALRDDRPRGRVPGGGVVAGITASVDTQDYGFWFEIRAWGYGGPELSKDSWCVKEGYVTTFGDLERVLWGEDLLDVDGNRYVISLTIQDALGHRTAEVYNFCVKHRGKIVPSIGRDTMAQPFTWTNLEFFPGTKKPIPGGLKGINVNTKHFKDELSRLLEIHPGDPSAWRYHAEFSEAHARHMTAEFVNDKGVWECPSGKENHLWDCASLNLVAAEILGIKFWPKPEDLAALQKSRKPTGEKAQPAVSRW